MASNYTTVDLSQLPLPAVVEVLSFEDVLSEMIADLQARDTSFSALVESDPAYKILEVCAYREVVIRQRVNDAAKAVMLAYAVGGDLDIIGASFDVERLLLVAADNTTIPPTAAVYETDDNFRRRIQLSFEGFTTAGSEGGYVFNALSASGDVKDVSVSSASPGEVDIFVLSNIGNGAASSDLLVAVETALNADSVRPLTDNVIVSSASIINYSITAQLVLYPGPDSSVVLEAAQSAINLFTVNIARLGYDVALSAIYAALQQPGVQQVNLSAPSANISIAANQASYCTGITLTVSTLTND